jgi:CubicO group peptidase (beta-lactamase class C family)
MADPRLLLLLPLLALVHAGAPPSSSDIVTGETGTRVDDYLTRLVPHGFSGAVLIARDGQVVLKKGYGLADRGRQVPYSASMASCIGSVTKQFTGAAIVKLEMEGRLKITDPISAYLPDVPADRGAITIHQLLTHTAGFPGDLGGGDEQPIGRDALVARVLAAPLASTPGERFEYSNEGYSLAGAIVEIVSGKGYEQYLREHLFLPAGMRDTGYLLPQWPIESLPVGYGEDGREWGRVYKRGWLPDGPGWYLRANGGIHSTLDDLYRWHVTLSAPGLFSAEALAKYQAGHVPSIGGERYGYGWGIERTRRGTTVVAHNGGNGIFFADFRRYVDEKVVIIAVTNQPVIRGTELPRRQLEALVFGDAPVVVPPAPVEVSASARAAVAGGYRLDDGSTVAISDREGRLEAEASDPSLFAAQPVTPPGGRFADLEARTLALVQHAAHDNFQPLHQAFDDGRPLEVVQGNQRRIWSDWRAEHGEFQRATLAGTSSVQGDPGVIVRLEFAKGSRLLQFIWGPRRLLGWRVMPASQPATLVPQSASVWVYYNYRLPHLVRVTFDAAGAISIARGESVVAGRRARD